MASHAPVDEREVQKTELENGAAFWLKNKHEDI